MNKGEDDYCDTCSEPRLGFIPAKSEGSGPVEAPVSNKQSVPAFKPVQKEEEKKPSQFEITNHSKNPIVNTIEQVIAKLQKPEEVKELFTDPTVEKYIKQMEPV